MTRRVAVGVNGGPIGWVSVNRQFGTGKLGVVAFRDASELLDTYGETSIVAIDVPIGAPGAWPWAREQRVSRTDSSCA